MELHLLWRLVLLGEEVVVVAAVVWAGDRLVAAKGSGVARGEGEGIGDTLLEL